MSESQGKIILEETASYIEKIEAVERDRKLSRDGELSEPTVQAEVSILIDQYQEDNKESDEDDRKYSDKVVAHTVQNGKILKNEETNQVLSEEIVMKNAVLYFVEGGQVFENMPEEKVGHDEFDSGSVSEAAQDFKRVVEYEYAPQEDAASSSIFEKKTAEQYYRENEYPEDDKKNKVEEDLIENILEEDAEVSENTSSNLPEFVEIEKIQVPTPAPRKETSAPIKDTTPQQKSTVNTLSQNDASSRQNEADFEELVLKNISQYKAEKSKSNQEVLASIEKEQLDENPNVKKLLAWAKSTRKQKTETMVVRQKKHDEKIKKAVNIGGVVDLVLKEKTTIIDGLEKPTTATTQKAVEKNCSVDQASIQRMAASYLGQKLKVENLIVSPKVKGCSEVRFEAEIQGAKKEFLWVVRDNEPDDHNNKEILIKRDLAQAMISETVVSSKEEHILPLYKTVFTDKKITVFDEDRTFLPANPNKPLDEIHLKVGMKALAKFHALSYVYLKRNELDPAVKDILTNIDFTNAGLRAETKLKLEKRLEKIFLVLQKYDGSKEGEIEQLKTLKSSLFNIYKEALTAPSVLPALCHGGPTLSKILFKYSQDGIPTEAKFVNFSDAILGSGVNDLHIFINTSGDNTAREDFLLRFVYYETLVTLISSYGEKVTFSYDDLKAEFVKKRLFGFIQSAALLADNISVSPGATIKPSQTKKEQNSGPRVVESKILGTFSLRGNVYSKAQSTNKEDGKVEGFEATNRIRDMMIKAAKI